MSDVTNHSQFRWARFIIVAGLGILAGMLAVEMVAPENYFRAATAIAEVDLRLVGSNLPAADQVRRRALSTANLSAVLRRLTDGSPSESTNGDDEESAATIERWRKQVAVEVRPGAAPAHCRIRFLITDERRNSDAAILAEAVAAQYAGELAAESWYALVDQLRSAEDISDAAINRLLNAVQQRSASVSTVTPAPIPFIPEFDSYAGSPDDEIDRLSRIRERLLESRTPEHPEVVALDARLEMVVAMVERSPIRRMSNETEQPPLTLPEPPMRSTGAVAGSSEIAAAVSNARAAVRARLDDLTTPGAVEAPVVTLSDGAGEIWELRNFWRSVICVPALVLAWSAARGSGIHRPYSSSSIDVDQRTEAAENSIADETSKPFRRSDSNRTKRSSICVPDSKLDTLHQVTETIGAPVLAVVSRRREPRPAASA